MMPDAQEFNRETIMNKRLVAAAMLLVLPGAAAAEQSMLCQSLHRRLAAIPKIIGSTAEVRRHAEALRFYNDEIRYLRTEMRRAGCGSGSIVSYGGADPGCGEMVEALRRAEAAREVVRAARPGAGSIVRPNGERNAILAAIDANRCDDIVNVEPLAAAPQMPAERNYHGQTRSSITDISPNPGHVETVQAPPPVERDYDPSKKVRTVGPVFLPNDSSIDLQRPASDGPQPRQ